MGRTSFPVVGIGASAGGVEALRAFFGAMPADPGMAFVVVTHLGPDRVSTLPDIIAASGPLPVRTIREGDAVQPGLAYVLSGDAVLTIAGGRLKMAPVDPLISRNRHPIDAFLASLADDQGETAVGILLSGGGSDGTLGLKAIKTQGGLTLAQATDEAGPQYSSMPASAIAIGVVDLVIVAKDMPARLVEFSHREGVAGLAAAPEPEADATDRIDAARIDICAILREQIGHDFVGYKTKTFLRRVARRMQVLRIEAIEAYVAHLRQNPGEVPNLFRDLLISVTGFFRDAEAFEALATRVIPELFEGRGADQSVRVWVPGCATGEEVYSLAMLLREHMEGLRNVPRVQVFATDIDEPALGVARTGRYPASLLTEVSPERISRHFDKEGELYSVTRAVRDLCVFSTHSVVRDAPFSRIDLVSCRNMLIYMGTELQERVIPVLHFSLRPGGFLFMGLSENITRHADLFEPTDKQHRIFRRRDMALPAGEAFRIARTVSSGGNAWAGAQPFRPARAPGGQDLKQLTGDVVLEHYAPPHLLVNAEGDILYQGPRLGRYLEPPTGTPTRALLAVARRGLRMELRRALNEAVNSGRRVLRAGIEFETEDGVQAVDLTVAPAVRQNEAAPLYVVLFTALGPLRKIGEARADTAGDADADDRVAHVERELRDNRERLQSLVEEYETAAEELKSANEELVSFNEEMQSVNEELETSKEEQQSINEELRTVNLELGTKIEELDRANADLGNLFDSTQIATVFLDQHLVIRNFTPAATNVFDLVTTDRGRPLTSFTSKVGGLNLREDVQRVLDRREQVQRRVAVPGSDVHYMMRLLPYKTKVGEVDGVVITFTDISTMIEREELRTLVDELNHRVKNMLQVVMAVCGQTLEQSPSLEAFGRSFKGRLHSLARAHELVSSKNWTHVLLIDLVREEIEPYAPGMVRISVEGPEVALTPNAALALGMVLHELATNAVKHGALSVEHGRLALSWSLEGEGQDALLRIAWRETGGPKVQAPTRRGFGSDLIERQTQHDLDGTVDIAFATEGLSLVLRLPMATIAPTGFSGPASKPD